jgi:dTDP-D-glucose 4,6-dehydratase
MPGRQWDTNTWLSDNRKICTQLGWQPRYTLEAGFRQMVAWFRDNPTLKDFYSQHRAEKRFLGRQG